MLSFNKLNKKMFVLGSFKIQKAKLIEEGYNCEKFSDKIYYYDIKQQSYQVLTVDIYEQILKCLVRF